MATTILNADGVSVVDALVRDDRVVVAADDLAEAIGWRLVPEGLCRGDLCIPVRDPDSITVGDGIDLVAVARALGSRTMLDADASVLAVGVPAWRRAEALQGRTAPDFELPDLDGEQVRLSEWRGRRRLLIAFASW